ncbi:hypothetical protein B0T19DRAFT_208841 [Cercophora scortea]|uniref:PH domain-containing protein n=1 Tax=Cercophora scortea TaxID=314031 RepID=A0AAE0IER6_9PEZI|nr:hypothetical protein B0T19DRAFT_208841 [Cercophora scortea]
MPNSPGPASPRGAGLASPQNQTAQSKRLRPPDPRAGNAEQDRVPLRTRAGTKDQGQGEGQGEGVRRRDSRLGLRSIFGRQKAAAPAAEITPAPTPTPRNLLPPRPGGIRASLAEISNWPYGLHGGSSNSRRSESTLPPLSTGKDAGSKSTPGPPPASLNLKHKKSASAVRGHTLPKGTRGSLASWDPPPLFQAYPQAIKYSHLSACTASAEVVLRLHNQKGSVSLKDGLIQSVLASDIPEESGGEKGEKARKRHRRTTSGSSLKFEWTTKTYVLVTSGYLLQYAGEGTFDRLPEKILHLGKDSAAFASDVIPGRHWVLQVSSAAESEGPTASYGTSRFSRLPFIGQEKKHVSNFLMVLDSANEMDSWIAILRREIEALGGKKHLSETGKPKADDHVQHLKNQTSQRTLVVRDPDRFSRVISPDLPWDPLPKIVSPDVHFDPADHDATRDQSFDDTSTASGISQDGRQLDGLRDSTHRLSYMSSGQRTVITSAGSSPACSPIRDSFANHSDDCFMPELQLQEELPRPRARPNAAAISDRRQSLQPMDHLLEMRVASAQALRPLSYSNPWLPDLPVTATPTAQTTPNFSVPQAVSKRYSLAKAPPRPVPAEPAPVPVPTPAGPGRTSSRRPPPSALNINSRPLSFVADQPSPLSPPLSMIKAHSEGQLTTAPDTPSMFSDWAQEVASDGGVVESSNVPRRNSITVPKTDSMPELADVRETASASFPKCPGSATDGHLDTHTHLPIATRPRDNRARSSSTMGVQRRALSPEPLMTQHLLQRRRLSLYSQSAERPTQLDSPVFDPRCLAQRPRAPSLKPVPRSSQHLRAESVSQSLLQRRSMSQLAEGPPPAPPPTRALPPIPPRRDSEQPPDI